MKIQKKTREKLEKFYDDKKRKSDKARTSGNPSNTPTTK